MNKKTTKVTCKKCGWTWLTKSKATLVSCPGCGSKVRVVPKKLLE